HNGLDPLSAIAASSLASLAMFNYRLAVIGADIAASQPLLDPITAILFVFGLALALYRIREPFNLVMLCVFGFALQAGWLSRETEPLVAVRSIAALPAVVYFATLPLVAFRAEWLRVFARSGGKAPALADK